MIHFDKPSKVYENLSHLKNTVTEEVILYLFDASFDSAGEEITVTLIENAEEAEDQFDEVYEGYELIGEDYVSLQYAYNETIFPLNQPWLPKHIQRELDEVVRRFKEWKANQENE